MSTLSQHAYRPAPGVGNTANHAIGLFKPPLVSPKGETVLIDRLYSHLRSFTFDTASFSYRK